MHQQFDKNPHRFRAIRFATCMIFILAMAVLPSSVPADSLDGRKIIDEVSDRHDRAFEFEVQKMTLVSKDGSQEVRQIKRYKRDVEEGSRVLLVFTEPAGVKGTALLTWENDAKDDDQWLYLPAVGDMKRIAEGGKRNYFMGTDYTYEDLTSESREKFTYTREADAAFNEQDCYVVKAVAKDPKLIKETGYKSRTIWVRKDNFVIVRTDYMDRRGRPIKTQTHEQLQQVEGDLWRANVSIMKNTRKKHITAIQTLSRSFEENDVPTQNFTSRFITSGKHVR